MRLTDADAVYKILTEFYHHRTDMQHTALKEALDRVPTIDAEPVKHGHWIKSQGGLKCSECGYYPLSRIILRGEKIWEVDVNEDLLYCPHCGAQMDEEVEK